MQTVFIGCLNTFAIKSQTHSQLLYELSRILLGMTVIFIDTR